MISHPSISRVALTAAWLLVGILPGGLLAERFRPAGFLYYKDIKPQGGLEKAAYGRLVLDADIVRYGGDVDVVPSQGGRALPYFRRAVPAPKGQTGTRTPKVIFEEKLRGGRRVYTLQLPEPPAGTHYVWLEVEGAGTYEAGVSLSLGTKPGAWEPAGSRALFRYRGSDNNIIRFRGEDNRYVRLELDSARAFTFPSAAFEPLRRVSEIKADIKAGDFKQSVLSDTRESVLLFENDSRRKLHRLVLRFGEERFRRRMRVESMEEKSFSHLLTTTVIRGKNDGPDQVIDFPRPITTAIKLTLENGDDSPLTLREVEGFTPLEEVVFALPEGAARTAPIRVYYGNRYARSPVYDIQGQFDPALPQAVFDPGQHQKNPEFAYSIVEPPVSTWVIRILFYLGLLGVLVPAYRVFARYAEATHRAPA